MKNLLVILLTGFLMHSASLIASDNVSSATHSEGEISRHAVLTGYILKSLFTQEENESGSTTPSEPMEEESEDEDDTSKEKVFQRMASMNLSLILEQLYSRQHSIFERLHLEIETPPPQHS